MQEKNNAVKLSLLGLLAVLMVYPTSQASMVLNPAIAAIEEFYQSVNPAVTHADMLLAASVVSFPMIFVGMISGAIVGKKVGYKAMTLFSIILIIVGGIIPYFAPGNVTLLLAARVILGIGMGIVQPLGNVLVMKFYKGDEQAKMMGIGTAVMNCGGVLVQMISGYVCTINPNMIWWIHLYCAVPLVLILFFMPEPAKEETEQIEKALGAGTGGVPMTVYLVSLAYGLCFMFFYAVLINCSSILIGEGLGTSVTAGTVSSLYTVGGVVAGITFGKVQQQLKKMTIPMYLVMYAVSFALAAYSMNSFMYMAASFLGGVAIFSIWPAAIMDFGEIVAPDRLGFASGVFTACLNIGAFGMAYFCSAVEKITGSANPRTPLRVGMIGMIIIGALWAAGILMKKDNKAKA